MGIFIIELNDALVHKEFCGKLGIIQKSEVGSQKSEVRSRKSEEQQNLGRTTELQRNNRTAELQKNNRPIVNFLSSDIRLLTSDFGPRTSSLPRYRRVDNRPVYVMNGPVH